MRGNSALWIGAALVAALILSLNAGALAAVIWRAGGWPRLGPADMAALRFTLVQAAWSAVLSVALAVPLARALARRRFAGRAALVVLLGAPFLLPSLVAVAGLLAVFGRAGWVNAALGSLGLPPVSIYGLHGVVIAHVFFNLPLAARLILQGWTRIPGEHLRLGASLGFGGWARFRHIELPMLAQVLPGALALVFVLCLTSFAVALTLGGGPRATTLELAIYQAFRFDFDLGRAAGLALVQSALGLGALVVLGRITAPVQAQAGFGRPHPAPPGLALAGWDMVVIGAGAAFVALPLLAVALRGLPALGELPPQVWVAAAHSLRVAGLSVVLLALMSALLTWAALRLRWAETLGLSALIASPLVIGTGLFIVIHPLIDPARVALPVIALVNAAMALPFALRAILPALRRVLADQGRLAASLGMGRGAVLRWVIWPALRAPAGFALGLGAALSVGDLGVVVLFGQSGGETLPLQVQRLMGAYRMDQAAGAALVLLVMALGLYAGIERILRGRDAGA